MLGFVLDWRAVERVVSGGDGARGADNRRRQRGPGAVPDQQLDLLDQGVEAAAANEGAATSKRSGMAQDDILSLVLVAGAEVGLVLADDGEDAGLRLARGGVAGELLLAGFAVVRDAAADGGREGREDSGVGLGGVGDVRHCRWRRAAAAAAGCIEGALGGYVCVFLIAGRHGLSIQRGAVHV